MDELGLFPLGIVLLPTEQLPLHIFEERYKELIGECLEEDGEFGLVYADDDGLRDLGTRARVVEVLTRFEDGRLNILVEGGERFRLAELTDGRSFSTGSSRRSTTSTIPPRTRRSTRRSGSSGCSARSRESEVDVPSAAPPQLSFALAGEGRAPRRTTSSGSSPRRPSALRMELVQELLANAVLTAQRVRRAAERASTNGRVDLG